MAEKYQLKIVEIDGLIEQYINTGNGEEGEEEEEMGIKGVIRRVRGNLMNGELIMDSDIVKLMVDYI